jgi:mutator protein MutT
MENLSSQNITSLKTSFQEKIIRHGAYGVVLRDAKILLTQKKAGPYLGLWGLPGGKIEYGESPEQTLKRELLEETTLEAIQIELLNIASATGEYTKDNQFYGFHQTGIIYRVLEWTDRPNHIPEEENRWISLMDIDHKKLTPFASQTISALAKTWRPISKLRGKVIGLATNHGKLLVCEVLDDDQNLKGWCPLGGGIEFGEKAEDALRREIREELQCDIKIIGDPILCENIFQHHGQIGHELIIAFPMALDNKEVYSKNRFQIHENKGSTHWVEWIPLENFKLGKAVLFPGALLDKLDHS